MHFSSFLSLLALSSTALSSPVPADNTSSPSFRLRVITQKPGDTLPAIFGAKPPYFLASQFDGKGPGIIFHENQDFIAASNSSQAFTLQGGTLRYVANGVNYGIHRLPRHKLVQATPNKFRNVGLAFDDDTDRLIAGPTGEAGWRICNFAQFPTLAVEDVKGENCTGVFLVKA